MAYPIPLPFTVIKTSICTQLTKSLRSKSGHHDTTVHEKVAPAVQNETINKHRHEDVQTAIDREVHQGMFSIFTLL